MKAVVKVVEDLNPSWIGDGFPSRALWYYGEQGSALSLFLVVDYIGPFEFPPLRMVEDAEALEPIRTVVSKR